MSDELIEKIFKEMYGKTYLHPIEIVKTKEFGKRVRLETRRKERVRIKRELKRKGYIKGFTQQGQEIYDIIYNKKKKELKNE